MALSVNSKIRELLENPALVALIDRLVPGLTSHPLIGVAKNFTLAKCAKLLPDVLTPEVMEKSSTLSQASPAVRLKRTPLPRRLPRACTTSTR